MDFDRKQIHLRQTKYNKDRYVPLSEKIIPGILKYKAAYSPKIYVFNGTKHGEPLSANGVQWAMKETLKTSGINKVATIHTLRHSFATHLLEMGMPAFYICKIRQQTGTWIPSVVFLDTLT